MKYCKIVNWLFFFVIVLGAAVFAVSEQEANQIGNAMPDRPVIQPAKDRTILVFSLCNGYKHSSIPYWAKTLDIMSEKTGAFKVVHSSDMSVFSPESLRQFDAICLNNTTGLVPYTAQQKAIMDFIKGGKGIVGIHAATDNFPQWSEGKQMMGGVFTGHPWGAGGTWAVKLDDPDHPLMKSFKGRGFKINDEIYRTEAPLYSRDNQRVLMSLDMSDPTTKNAKGVRPDDMDTGITWIKPIGKGRLFYCSLGHVHAVTWNSAVLEHLLAGIQYALADYKVDDTPLGEPQQKLNTDTLNSLLEELKTYDWDRSRAGNIKIQQMISSYRDNPETLAVIEGRLLELLESDISLASKDFICRQLSTIGTDQSVLTLSKMLTDKETSNIARYALEKIPGEAVDNEFLKSLEQTDQTDIQIGIITSLGARRSEKAVSDLAVYAKSSDVAVAVAAVEALGSIGTRQAADLLGVVLPTVQMGLKQRTEDGLLRCAKRLAQSGNDKAAENIFRQMYSQSTSSLIRAGALTGLIQLGANDTGRLLSEAIASDDVVMRQAALRVLADIMDEQILEAVASDASNLSEPVQIQLLTALASNPEKVGMSEALKLIQSDDQSVRIAAYRALAQIGDATVVHPLAVAAAESKDRREREAAQNALYRISGKDIDQVILEKLKEAGKTDSADSVVIQYVQSTARRPVWEAVEVLLDLALSDDRKLSSESTKALQSLAGPEHMDGLVEVLIARPDSAKETMLVIAGQKESNVDRRADALLAKYSAVSDEKVKVSMLRVMGKLRDPDSIPLLRKEYDSENPVLIEAAFRAMVDWPADDFKAEMKKLAQSSDDTKTKILAFRAYIQILNNSEDKKNVDEMIAAYTMAERADEQKIVIAALGDHGNLKAMAFVEEKVRDSALKAEAQVSLVQICEKLISCNPSSVKSVLKMLKNCDNESVKTKATELLANLPNLDGMVLDWKTAGPYAASGKVDKVLFNHAFPIENDINQGKWQDAEQFLDNNRGVFNLNQLVKGDNKALYFKTTILVEKEMPAILGVGSDDGVKLWLNGKLVHANNAIRPVKVGQDKVNVQLQKGQNQVFVKVVQYSGNCGFCMNIADSNGNEIPGLHVDAGN